MASSIDAPLYATMLTLIAESKTMRACDTHVDAGLATSHTPLYNSEATTIMMSLYSLDLGELAKAVKISTALVAKLRLSISDFPDRSTGCSAIEAFTGVVFKAFDYPTLPEQARCNTTANVRIISSLYGWLRPDDVIKAYRLDFTSHAGPQGETMSTFWRTNVTDALLAELDKTGETEILDLLPGDAAKCIDWKRVKAVAKVAKADFVEPTDGGRLKTPHSGRLKMLRGSLLRQIVCDGIGSFSEVSELVGADILKTI